MPPGSAWCSSTHAGGSWPRTTAPGTFCAPATACSTATGSCSLARLGTTTVSRTSWDAPLYRSAPGVRAARRWCDARVGCRRWWSMYIRCTGGRRTSRAGRWRRWCWSSTRRAGPTSNPGVVAADLDLTGMQSRVAVLLAQGMSVPEIAAATGRKESTIRSHVKHAFARHGLTRQAELVRLGAIARGYPGDPEVRAPLPGPTRYPPACGVNGDRRSSVGTARSR